jgi:DNA-binding NtrC family response regulator
VSDATVLIVDDEPDMVENCTRILRRAGYHCVSTTDPTRAFALLESEHPDLLVTDLQMPHVNGLELMRRAHELDAAIPVVVITAYASIETAVAAIKQGAYDYLPKTFTVDQLTVTVERALRARSLSVENRNLREQLQEVRGLESLVGASLAMARVVELVKKSARAEANILVQGESGTGKELIARAVHANSPRAAQPFVPVDCASLPEALLESELFGHEKGAFTGAVRTKPGLMEVAHRGTLFLDEIAELPMALQVKLLRALQERQFRRVGGTALTTVDVRVVSATNRDLRAAIAAGEFREDLFYRVDVIEIALPPLRAREGDVRLLAQAFLKKYGHGRVTSFEPEALEVLETHRWPGNVRELQNVVERACALADGAVVKRRDLPDYLLHASDPALTTAAFPVTDLPLKDAKDQWMSVLEANYLRDVLAHHDGNISAAAKTAGIDRKTFHRLIIKYSLKD